LADEAIPALNPLGTTASLTHVPFATGTGANVEAQATWVSDAVVPNGFSAGIASSAKVNKAHRQATFVASSLAQVIANALAQSVPDDGNQATFVTNLINALQVVASEPLPYSSSLSAAIGGYPLGTVLSSASAPGLRFVSLTANNTDNPDTTNNNWGRVVTVISENTGVTGHRAYSDGWIEEWGRTTVAAGASVTVNMQVTHNSYINPVLGANITIGGGAANFIGISALGLNSFAITNNGTTSLIVPWNANGR